MDSLEKELNSLMDEEWRARIFPLFDSGEFEQAVIKMDKEKTNKIFEKYVGKGACDYFSFYIDINTLRPGNPFEAVIRYKGKDLEANGFYIKHKGYKPVTMAQIVVEAVKQDTANPNIKHLELPEENKTK